MSDQLKYLDVYIDTLGNITNTDYHDDTIIQYSNVFVLRIHTPAINWDTIAVNILQPNGITLPQKQLIAQTYLIENQRIYLYRLSQLDTSICGSNVDDMNFTFYITSDDNIITTESIDIPIELSVDSEVVIGDNTSLTNLAENLNGLSLQYTEIESTVNSIIELGGIQGPQGEVATINVGTTQTGVPGSEALVTNVGTDTAGIFNFVIPTGNDGVDGEDGRDGVDGYTPIKGTDYFDGVDGEDGFIGFDGDDGVSATITVGTITTGEPYTNAIVTNVGTELDAIFDITIPKGAAGDITNAAIGSLNDVYLSTLADGQVLKWDETGSRWINADDDGGEDNLVTSVNTQIGDVVLDFTDVNATPEVTQEDIGVLLAAGEAVGSYVNGMTIPAGTSVIDIIKKMLQRTIEAVYTVPSFSTSFSGMSSTAEVGATYTENIVSSFTQNDGGVLDSYIVERDGMQLVNSSSLQSWNSTTVLPSTPLVYRTRAHYEQGPQKQNNIGEDSGTPIPADYTSYRTLNVYPKYAMYYGASPRTDMDTITEAELKAEFSKTIRTNYSGQTITYSALPEDQTLMFATPANVGQPYSIIYDEQGNVETLDLHEPYREMHITDAGGVNSILYNVYYYTGAITFGGDMTLHIYT